MSHAKFHCSKLKTAQDIQDYARLIFYTQSRYNVHVVMLQVVMTIPRYRLQSRPTVGEYVRFQASCEREMTSECNMSLMPNVTLDRFA